MSAFRAWDGPGILDVARVSGREPRKAGSQYRVRCPDPRHADAHPSCDLDDDKNTFICRSCGAHGGVLAFANLVGVRLVSLGSNRPPLRKPGASRRVPKEAKQALSDAPALWNAAHSVLDDPEVIHWLQSRGLDADAVDLMAVARALPTGTRVPSWARSRGGCWPETGHRLILRLFDDSGRNVGIRARRICAPADGLTKSLSPCGLTTTGLMLANCLGQALLSLSEEAAELVRQVGVVIAEGDVDFLLWSSEHTDSDMLAPAVFGITNKSWTDEIAGRVPDGTLVTIRAHDDQPGRDYARVIGRSLHPRCRVRVLEVRS